MLCRLAKQAEEFPPGITFDSSAEKGPFKFTLGKNKVIKGWEIAVASMTIGEKAKVECRADVGYGNLPNFLGQPVYGFPGGIQVELRRARHTMSPDVDSKLPKPPNRIEHNLPHINPAHTCRGEAIVVEGHAETSCKASSIVNDRCFFPREGK